MTRGGVIAGSHDDVEPSGAGDPRQAFRVAADAVDGAVDDALTARHPKEQGFVYGFALVQQAQVVQVLEGVVTQPAQILDADRLVGPPPLARRGGQRKGAGQIDEQVFVRQGNAQLVAANQAQDSLDSSDS